MNEQADRDAAYAEIVQVFSFALNQYRLYSAKHPATQSAARNLSGKLQQALKSEDALSVGTVEGRLLVNEVPFVLRDAGAAGLLRDFERLRIESLIFEAGVGEDELLKLFQLMSGAQKVGESRGVLDRQFDAAGLRHIRLTSAHYELVEEDQEESDAEAEVEVVASDLDEDVVQRIERMSQLFDHCLLGDTNEILFDADKLASELKEDAQGPAQQMVRRALDVDALKTIVEGTASFLVQRLGPPLLNRGDDLSQPVLRLARAFRKVLDGSEVPEGVERSKASLAEVLDRAADELKAAVIARAWVDGGRDPAALSKIVASLAQSQQTRLFEFLKQRLVQLGVSAEELQRLWDRERQRLKPGEVPVAAAELAELRRIRDQFQAELERQLKQAVAGLEKENNRVLGEKERVDAVIRNLAEGLVVVDNEGRVQLMNPAAERLLGMDREKGRGAPLSQFLKDEHLVALAKGPLRDQAEHVTKEIEIRSVRDETRRILQASSAVIENEDGKTVGMVSVLSDITRQRQLEEMKSAFVARVSHELRTPLLAIEQSLALLLEKEAGAVTAHQEQFLSIAHRNIARLSRLVSDLLDVAKLEAGQMRLERMEFKICDMVHHVVETVRGWAGNRELAIEEVYPDADPEVEADPDRLTQVVTNLVGNALKFTPPGGKIRLEIDPQYRAPDISQAPCIAVSVQDTGIGIAKADQERIFHKFEQVSLATPKGVSSTGLGLTIAKEIVELHGGKIWVESNQGEGSRFIFVIPRVAGAEPVAASDGLSGVPRLPFPESQSKK
jgi:PAS domain S-box-containing protein